MHRSISMANDKSELLQLFIQQILKGDKSYAKSVNNVIIDTHDLVTGKKDIYTINRVNFPIVIYLSENFSDVFKNLDVDNISNHHYQKLIDILNTKLELA